MYLGLLIFAIIVAVVIIAVALIKAITLKRYNRKYKFGYNVSKDIDVKTGIPVLDEILKYNPNFMANGLEKTNLAAGNRIDQQTGQPITLVQTYERYPEEKVRLACYLKCIKKFGVDRVELEFPIQVGSKKCFIDVAVFGGDPNNKSVSKEHSVMNLIYVFECKKDHPNPNIKDKFGNPETMNSILKSGYQQLIGYMSVCPNLCEKQVRDAQGNLQTKLFGCGCLTNGSTVRFFKRITNKETGRDSFVDLPTPSWYN